MKPIEKKLLVLKNSIEDKESFLTEASEFLSQSIEGILNEAQGLYNSFSDVNEAIKLGKKYGIKSLSIPEAFLSEMFELMQSSPGNIKITCLVSGFYNQFIKFRIRRRFSDHPEGIIFACKPRAQ